MHSHQKSLKYPVICIRMYARRCSVQAQPSNFCPIRRRAYIFFWKLTFNIRRGRVWKVRVAEEGCFVTTDGLASHLMWQRNPKGCHMHETHFFILVIVSQRTPPPHSQYVWFSAKWMVLRERARSCSTHACLLSSLCSTSMGKSSIVSQR